MKSFNITYYVSKKSKKTLRAGGEKIQEAWGVKDLVSASLRKLKISRTFFILVSCLMLAAFVGFNDYVNSFFHVVYFNGQEIGLVKDVNEVESMVEEFIDNKEAEYQKEVFTDCEISFTEAEYHFGGIVDLEIIKNVIDNSISYYSWAYKVYLDGEPVVYMECEEDLEQLMESIKERYIPVRRDVSLVSMDFGEKITGEWIKSDPADIKSLGEAYLVFNPEPKEERIYFASRGDSQNNPTASIDPVSEASHSEININEANEDSGLNMLSVNSLLTVLTVEEQNEEEEIPFETKTVYNNEVESGKTKTLNEGVKGIKKITYHVSKENGVETDREKIGTEVVREPEDRVIEHGTKLAGGGTLLAGTGQFSWPVPSSYDGGGRIMRGFAGGHSGLDIYAGTLTSTPIIASDSGTVVLSGYNGGYGNTVVLNHGSYYTVYAHNSRNLVSVGDSVSKGTTIAYMGNTGQTYGRTGIHLHFEIRVASGGWQQSRPVNPMSFF